MNERIRPTRSGLFIIELLVMVGVFAFCAAICLAVFVKAEGISRSSAELTRAVSEAKSVAECWKATGGDLERTAELCGGTIMQGTLWIHYDMSWNRLSGEEWDGYRVRLLPQGERGYLTGVVQAHRAGEIEPIFSWTVAVLEAQP